MSWVNMRCHECCWVEAVVDAGGGTSVEGLACWVRNCVNLCWLSGFGSGISESLSTLVNASPRVWMSALVGSRYLIIWRRLNSFLRIVTMVVAFSWVALPMWRSDRSLSASRSGVYWSGCMSTAGAWHFVCRKGISGHKYPPVSHKGVQNQGGS